MYTLEISKGSEKLGSRELALDVALRIGRDAANDVVLPDVSAGRTHAQIVGRGSSLYLEDLGSTNGTRLNGRVVNDERLHDGDKIRIGDCLLCISDDGEDGKTRFSPGIRVMCGVERGMTCELNVGEQLVGRDEGAEIRLNDSLVSARHALIIRDEHGVVYVKDLNSKNGTRVNGAPCIEGKVLHDGDNVRFAHVKCRFSTDITRRALPRPTNGVLCCMVAGLVVCVLGVASVRMALSPAASIRRADGLCERGEYEQAIEVLYAASSSSRSRSDTERALLIGASRRVRALAEMSRQTSLLHVAVSNMNWDAIERHATALVSSGCGEHVVEEWLELANCRADVVLRMTEGDVEGAWRRLESCTVAAEARPQALRKLRSRVKIEMVGLDVFRRASKLIKDGRIEKALDVLGQIPDEADMYRSKCRAMLVDVKQLLRMRRAIGRYRNCIRSGDFDGADTVVFPVSSGWQRMESAKAAADLEWRWKESRLTGAALHRRCVKTDSALMQWMGSTLEMGELADAQVWIRDKELVLEGVRLKGVLDSLRWDMVSDRDLAWVCGGDLDAELSRKRGDVGRRLEGWQAGLLEHANKALVLGQRRQLALALKMREMLHSVCKDICLGEKGVKSCAEYLAEIEGELAIDAANIFNEAYMLQQGSAARIDKMHRVVETGLPYMQCVVMAAREVRAAKKGEANEDVVERQIEEAVTDEL